MLARRTKSFAVDMIVNHDATYNEARMATGIATGTLARAVKHFKQTGEVYRTSGRPPRLPKASIEKLSKIVTNYSKLQAALVTPRFAELVREEEKLLASKNGKRVDKVKIDIEYARRLVKIHWKTKYKGKLGASVQSRRRAEAAHDPRNFLSCICMFKSTLFDDPMDEKSPHIPAHLITNVDATGLTLTSEGCDFVGEVITTEEASIKLEQQHRGTTKLSGEAISRVYVPSYFVTTASGQLLVSAYLIKDDSVEGTGWDMFRAQGLNNTGGGAAGGFGCIYVMNKKFDEKKWIRHFIVDIIVPAMIANQVQHEGDHQQGNVKQRCLLTLDGDIPQVEIFFDKETHKLFAENGIEVAKFPAATSGYLQPNDVMRAFPLAKRFVKQLADLKYAEVAGKSLDMPAYYSALEKWLVDQDLALFRLRDKKQLILQFFKHLPTILHSSFTVKVVKKGYETCGINPFDHVKIMEQCSAWDDMTDKEVQSVLNAIEPLTQEFMTADWTTEKKMDELMVPVLTDEQKQWFENATEQSKKAKRQTKPLNEMIASRQRAMLLTGHAALQRRSQVALDKLNALKEKEFKKKAAEIAKKYAEENKVAAQEEKIKKKAMNILLKKVAKVVDNEAKQDAQQAKQKQQKAQPQPIKPVKRAAKKVVIGIVQVKCLICSRSYDEFNKYQQQKWNQCNGCNVHFCQDHLDSMSGHVKFCKKAK